MIIVLTIISVPNKFLRNKIRSIFCFLFCFLCSISYSQTDTIRIQKNTSFREGICNISTWNKPFLSDMLSTISKVEVAYATNSPEYDYGLNGGKYRPFIFSTLGKDLPIWAGNFDNNQYGFSCYIPFFIDIWLDMFERSTAPLIHTTYSYGFPEFSFIKRLRKPFLGINNYTLKVDPFRHGCNHLGDELTLMRKEKGFVITRVNDSYNYAEIGITINDPDNSRFQNHSFRLGIIRVWDTKKGWYNILPIEGDTSKVTKSISPYEFYFQYQFQSNTNPKLNIQYIASIELRNKVRFNYPFYTYIDGNSYIENKGVGERSWNLNAFIGLRYNNPKLMKYNRFGAGIRYYYGINPYGQFRSIPNYTQIGLILFFE